MTHAYYNENDEFAADWLRNLIKAGLIADGEVDTRSIVDVRPGELSGFTQCHFFAGIGGWSYALRAAGWPDDIAVWTGSCPCQPFSLAGKQKGFSDERHLWPVWRELIRECDPAIVFGEQVASATEWLGLVRGDLEAMGRAVGAMPIQAASAGADHLRDRYWFVAYANDAGSQGRRILPERAGQRAAGADGLAYANGERGQVDQDTGGRADGGGAGPITGPCCARDGDVADSNQPGSREERQQRGWEQCGLGCDPGPCVGSYLADAERGGCESVSRQSGIRGGEISEIAIHQSGTDRENDAADLEWVIGADGKARRVKSGIRLLAHGVPNRVGLLRGFGNAIDHRPAKDFIIASMEALSLSSQQSSTGAD